MVVLPGTYICCYKTGLIFVSDFYQLSVEGLYFTLFYFILFYFILFYFMLLYFILFYFIFYFIFLFYFILFYLQNSLSEAVFNSQQTLLQQLVTKKKPY